MADCIFCKIAKGEIETELLYKDEEIVAFCDIQAKAPIHILVIPTKHIPSLAEMEEGDYHLIGRIYQVIQQLAEEKGIQERGYRVVVNCNHEGGQTVSHLHFHLLGGRQMKWPPG